MGWLKYLPSNMVGRYMGFKQYWWYLLKQNLMKMIQRHWTKRVPMLCFTPECGYWFRVFHPLLLRSGWDRKGGSLSKLRARDPGNRVQSYDEPVGWCRRKPIGSERTYPPPLVRHSLALCGEECTTEMSRSLRTRTRAWCQTVWAGRVTAAFSELVAHV